MFKPKKGDFLTIPFAPNYEINGYFKVRNKTTGKILKPYSPPTRKKSPNKVISLKIIPGKHKTCSLRVAYAKAVSAFLNDADDWLPVESLKNLYELNEDGALRNAKTKYELKPRVLSYGFYYRVTVDNRSTWVSRKKLLNECFFKKYPVPQTAGIPVMFSKGGLMYRFKSFHAGAKFLAGKLFYSWKTIVTWLVQRPLELYGYQVKYLR